MATTTTVGTSLTTIAEVSSNFAEFIGFQVVNGTGAALNAFQVQARVAASAPWVTLRSADFDGNAGDTFPAWATGDPTTLATSGSVILAVLGKHWGEVRLRASVASGSTEVVVYSRAA